jgi:hypothetical protein
VVTAPKEAACFVKGSLTSVTATGPSSNVPVIYIDAVADRNFILIESSKFASGTVNVCIRGAGAVYLLIAPNVSTFTVNPYSYLGHEGWLKLFDANDKKLSGEGTSIGLNTTTVKSAPWAINSFGFSDGWNRLFFQGVTTEYSNFNKLIQSAEILTGYGYAAKSTNGIAHTTRYTQSYILSNSDTSNTGFNFGAYDPNFVDFFYTYQSLFDVGKIKNSVGAMLMNLPTVISAYNLVNSTYRTIEINANETDESKIKPLPLGTSADLHNDVYLWSLSNSGTIVYDSSLVAVNTRAGNLSLLKTSGNYVAIIGNVYSANAVTNLWFVHIAGGSPGVSSPPPPPDEPENDSPPGAPEEPLPYVPDGGTNAPGTSGTAGKPNNDNKAPSSVEGENTNFGSEEGGGIQ